MRDWLEDTLGIGETTQNRILATVVVLSVILAVRWLAVRAVNRRTDNPTTWFRVRKSANYLAGFASLIAIWRIWFSGLQELATFLGLVSAGLAIALADVLKNLAGGLYLAFQRPFKTGDRIQVGDHIGDVVDIGVFRFSMLEIGNWVDADQSTGRILDIPNGIVFTTPSASYTGGFNFIWHEVAVLITFESDWQQAEALVRSAMFEVAPDPREAAEAEVRDAAMQFLIRLPQLEPGTYVSVGDSGVLVTARMLIRAENRRGIDDLMWRALLERINAEPTVVLAYPTVRTYLPDPLEVRQPS